MEWNPSPVEDKIGIHFKNSDILFLSLTHSSYAQQINEPENDNERLEFLGEKLLNLVVIDYLYHHFPYLPMGKLAPLQEKLIEGERLTQLWFTLGLGESYPFIATKDERHRLRLTRNNPFEKALKALVAAIHLDRGFSQSYNWLSKHLINPLLERHQKDEKERVSPDKQLQLLGNVALKGIVTDYLYRLLPYINPGRLSKLSKTLVAKEQQVEYVSKLTELDWQIMATEKGKVSQKSFPVLLGAMYLHFGQENSKTGFKKTSDWFLKGFVDEDEVLRQAIALLLKDGIPQKWIIRQVMGYDSKDYNKGRERFHELMETTT